MDVQTDAHLREGARELVARAVETAHGLLASSGEVKKVSRGGRKANARAR